MAQWRMGGTVTIYALVAIGFAGLIGAHEISASAPASEDNAAATLPLVLAGIGTLAFIIAGVTAFKLLRRGGSN
jgi:uncharacterized membrane protein